MNYKLKSFFDKDKLPFTIPIIILSIILTVVICGIFKTVIKPAAVPAINDDQDIEDFPSIENPKEKIYDYSNPMPSSYAVDKNYFDDAIFIGNSQTDGFVMFSGLYNTTSYASTGLTVSKVLTEKTVDDGDEKLTVVEAFTKNNTWKKAYILLGTNELGWVNTALFKEKYGEIIDKLKNANPNAEIYIQSILPTSEELNKSDDVFNNDNIEKFNRMLKELAYEKSVYYLNVAEALTDTEGYLFSDASSDGIHLSKKYCLIWLEYLSTHTAHGFYNND
jgi:lysophospholipase L1-like esterase